MGLPVLGCLFLGVVGPTAGRFYIDVASDVTPKQFIRGEWFVGTAVLTASVWILVYWAGGNTWWAMGLAFAVGFTFRVLALYRGWEEPLPRARRASFCIRTIGRFSAASWPASHSRSCATWCA